MSYVCSVERCPKRIGLSMPAVKRKISPLPLGEVAKGRVRAGRYSEPAQEHAWHGIHKDRARKPAGWIYLDAKNAQGKIVNWAMEISGPNVINRNGFDRSVYQAMVESGEEVTVTAYAARDGSKHAWAGGLTRADGRTVITLSGIPNQGRGRGGPPPQ